MSSPKIHCFYHSSDLDGHCSGAIVKFSHPNAIMHPINYGMPFPFEDIHPDDTVYMVDFSLFPEQMDRLNQSCVLWWIDHHITAIDAWNEYVTSKNSRPIAGKLEVGKAACQLTWDFLHDYPAPLGVKLLGLYDVWDHRDERVLPFQMRLRMEQLDPKDWSKCEPVWLKLFHGDLNYVGKLIHEGGLILQYDTEQKRRYAATYAFEVPFPSSHSHLSSDDPEYTPPYRAVAVNLGHTNSKVFDSVYDPAKHDLMVSFVRRKDRLWNVSLYSTHDRVHCGEIARMYEGGGHKGAAGFSTAFVPFNY